MTALPVEHACSRKYFPAMNSSGPRHRSQITVGVIHSTGGPSDETAAAYFRSGGTPAHRAGSTQLVVDDDSCERCLADLTIPWGAPPLNTPGVHVEQAGDYPNRWSRETWLLHEETIVRAAYKMAAWCQAYDIPPRWLTVADLRAAGLRPHGVTSHNNISLAYHASTHTDCAPPYPVDVFLSHLRSFV